MNKQTIVLASGSKYRQALLKKLAIPFSFHAPDIDESAKESESPLDWYSVFHWKKRRHAKKCSLTP